MQSKILLSNVEQLELALDHLNKGDPNNARFALMLIDNVLELTFHHIAKDKETEMSWKRSVGEIYEHEVALKMALGRNFEHKVRFARIFGLLNLEEDETINRCHHFRNELYHVGLQHEPILSVLTKFYLYVAGEVLSRHNLAHLSHEGLNGHLPERLKNYFSRGKFGNFPLISEYREACSTISKASNFDAQSFSETLAKHAHQLIDEADIAIDTLATGGQLTRDKAVLDSMAWKVAFTEEAQRYSKEKKCPSRTVAGYVEWIGRNYPIKLKSDPIDAWRKRINSVAKENNPHKALKKYCDFIDQTVKERAILGESHGDFDLYIEHQIEVIRGN